MWRNLLGLALIRGGGDEDPESSYGTDLDRSRLRQVRLAQPGRGGADL